MKGLSLRYTTKFDTTAILLVINYYLWIFPYKSRKNRTNILMFKGIFPCLLGFSFCISEFPLSLLCFCTKSLWQSESLWQRCNYLNIKCCKIKSGLITSLWQRPKFVTHQDCWNVVANFVSLWQLCDVSLWQFVTSRNPFIYYVFRLFWNILYKITKF